MVVARGLALTCLIVASAHAQPNRPPEARPALPALVGATEVVSLTAPSGFIDDVVAADGDRVAYVIADGAAKAELHVLTLASKHEAVVDVSPVTVRPVALRLVGQRAFVVGRLADGNQVAALVELAAKGKRPAGRTVYKIASAAHITPIVRDGKQRVAVHRTTETPAGIRHTVEVLAIETGRRIARPRSLVLDATGTDKKHAFRVNHWSDGYTRAHGIKSGEWDRKEDQRTPDAEGTYDFVTGKLAKRTITDLFEQRRRFQALAGDAARGEFLALDYESDGLHLWHDAAPRPLELDQPLTNYDSRSLQGVVTGAGAGWLALTVDPVNPDAVARKKADPVYLDVFRIADGKAARRARIFAKGTRYRFGIAGGDRFWLLERNQGFDRGGKRLTVYQLQ
jgi:hypothetical protein